MEPTAWLMTHITCRLTAKNRDQLRNPTLGNRVWATFTFYLLHIVLFSCIAAVWRLLLVEYVTFCYGDVFQTWPRRARRRTRRAAVRDCVRAPTYRTSPAAMPPLRAASANEATTSNEEFASVSPVYTSSIVSLCDPGPDLPNILRQTCDYLAIMPKSRSTYTTDV